MRPMELKEPTKCCQVQTLAWVKEKQYFVCKCGQFKVSETGHPLGKKRWVMDVRRKMNRLPKL